LIRLDFFLTFLDINLTPSIINGRKTPSEYPGIKGFDGGELFIAAIIKLSIM
jgi:hypothetical protein